ARSRRDRRAPRRRARSSPSVCGRSRARAERTARRVPRFRTLARLRPPPCCSSAPSCCSGATRRAAGRAAHVRRRARGLQPGRPTRSPRKETTVSKLQIVLGLLLAVFGFETAWFVAHQGLTGWTVLFESDAGRLALFDLTIALSLVMVWMWGDARARHATVCPYLIVLCAFRSL